MTLLSKILNYVKLQNTQEAELQELYAYFKDEKQTTIRGRINEVVGKKLIRAGRGRYILISDDVDAIVEKCDSKIAVPYILASLIYYDMIFLDIPYKTSGQKSGNRNILTYDLIEPEEFEKMALSIEKMLRTEDSQVYFMIAGGKSSAKDALKYLTAFGPTNLKVAAKGSYTKLTNKGSVANMGKYPMPPEDIFIYSHSGKLAKPEETILDFELTRAPLPKQGGYPTQKPLSLLKQIIKQSTNIGDKILDLFGGSGVTLQAALELNRKCHIFDIADDAIFRMHKILRSFETKVTQQLQQSNTTTYSNDQLAVFANGSLF